MSFTKEQLENVMASASDEACQKLCELGVITFEQYETFILEWTPVMIDRRSLITKLRDIIFRNTDDDVSKIYFIKVNDATNCQCPPTK